MKRKNTTCIIMSICILLALVFSIVALCVACPRVISRENLGFDYIGVLVGILALLVTALLGWNIYTAIDIDNKIAQFKYSVSISTCISLNNLGKALYNNEDYANALHAFLNAIYMYEKEAKNEMMDDAFQCSTRNVKNIKQKSVTIECTNKEYIRFVCAASKTDDKDIISYVRKFKVI